MPQNTPTNQISANIKAAIGTSIVVVLLVFFAGAGFWYGKNRDVNNANENTNVTKEETQKVAIAGNTTIAGKIQKVLGEAIELLPNGNDAAQVITAKISDTTALRKVDLRSIPKNGVGEGTVITKKDLIVGANVVVYTENVNSNTIDATKINVVILP